MKRKRPRHAELSARKKSRAENAVDRPTLPDAAVLHHYYTSVKTLRDHLVSKVSRRRRQHLKAYGCETDSNSAAAANDELARLLDTVLVCSRADIHEDDDPDSSITNIDVSTISVACSAVKYRSTGDLIDSCIQELFKRSVFVDRPQNILCSGFSRNGGVLSRIPGIMISDPNPYVERLSRRPWADLPQLLGQDTILIDLFLNFSIFDVLHPGSQNWIQLCGIPLSELKAVTAVRKDGPDEETPDVARLNDIRFVRHRMFYGKPVFDARGGMRCGQRLLHVLNRQRDIDSHAETVHVMKYIFPRQFGLHNVFTSSVTKAQSSQQFLDYTIREDEIARQSAKVARKSPELAEKKKDWLPKRLRGTPFELVKRIRKRHEQCSYHALLQHYCPRSPVDGTSDRRTFDSATPAAKVSAFCQAVVRHVFPSDCWEPRATHQGASNSKLVMLAIDKFIRLARFENMSLHSMLDGISIACIEWLMPPQTKANQKMCRPEFDKRKDIFFELVYYLIDSFLIPLISATFYVTESSVERGQLLFFRHDVWRDLSTPALTELRTSMFEVISPGEWKRTQWKRQLGVSRIRLLPKETGLRPIMNLKRKSFKDKSGVLVIGKSINSLMRPAFSVLKYLKNSKPSLLGCSIFSADEIYPKLQAFRHRLSSIKANDKPLYFVKVDVKACFDTIPQTALLALLERIVSQGDYKIAWHSEAKVLRSAATTVSNKVSWKHTSEACAFGQSGLLSQGGYEQFADRRGRVIVDKVSKKYQSRDDLLQILREHIGSNTIQIGRRMYRQKVGIPQGSVVSSLLCSIFYGQLDQSQLAFLMQDSESLLVRLIDDFLLVTTDRDKAERFLRIMHSGLADFGITVRPEKTKTNFRLGNAEPGLNSPSDCTEFLYCGLSINTKTLDVSMDPTRRRANGVGSIHAVETSKNPGQSFSRKAIDMVKLQIKGMLMSTSFNSADTVASNLHAAFEAVAWRCLRYLSMLSHAQQPGPKLLIGTMEDVVGYAVARIKQSRPVVKGSEILQECSLSRWEIQSIAYKAMLGIFERRQTRLRGLIDWLRWRIAQPEPRARKLMSE